MRYRQALCVRASILAAIFTLNHSHAQTAQTAIAPPPSAGSYAVTEHGENYRVWQKTTLEHGTNHIHRYVEVATGMYYTNSSGQLTEASEQITLLPQGGAAATQGRHQVYFPADIYNGVLEVVTPDGKHLKSRPLGVSYDDGSNTAFIATLKHSIGYLTSSNQVTYPDAFTGFKADLVCTYRRSGFESDLVFRQQPPTPDEVGLNNSSSTLQMVTEFFNTTDPQEIAGHPNKRFGLQDTMLKFGGMTMAHGKAFAIQTTNAATFKSRTSVYKKWVHVQGRTFLIEQVPLTAIARELDALPLTASLRKPSGKVLFASQHPQFPPAHGMIADTKQILLASANFNQKPGVVLDYDEIDADLSDFTFASGTTYLVDNGVYLGGTTTFEGGTIIKVDTMSGGFYTDSGSTLDWETDPYHLAIFTSINDDSVGESMAGCDPNYTGTPTWVDVDFFGGSDFPVHDAKFSYGGTVFEVDSDISFTNVQFFDCYDCFVGSDTVTLNNSLVSQCGYVADLYEVIGNNVTFDQLAYGIIYEGNANLNNCILSDVTNIIFNMDWSGIWDDSASFTLSGNFNGFYDSPEWELGSYAVTNTAYPFQSVSTDNYYLTTSSPFRGVGSAIMDLSALTTYTPADGGWPDINSTDLGYHYPANADYDNDGLPDWWEYKYLGNLDSSGTDYDAYGDTLAYDYANGIDPNTGLPDWWLLNYFGNLDHYATDLDSTGDNTLFYDYVNGLDPNVISFTLNLGNQIYNDTNATGQHVILAGIPSYEAVLINDTNFNDAVWTAYDGTVAMNLGSTDGVYQVWVGLEGMATNATATWIDTTVRLDRVAPQVTITSPTNNSTVALPYIQLLGYAPETLCSVTYDLSNAVAVVTNQPGLVIGRYFDTNLLGCTTDTFQCFDIPLTNGVNRITIHATDLAGNTTTTNCSITQDYSTATNPIISLTWPQNGMQVCGNNFTVRGIVNDPTVTVMAQITDTNGDTNVIIGEVERTGVLWAENLPLGEGTNEVTLWVTNVAGLSNTTNFCVVKNDMTLALTSITGDLWQPPVSVNGVISDTSATVWVNGVQGTNNGDGTWSAANVPVSTGGVASFDMKAGSSSSNTNASTNVVTTPEITLAAGSWSDEAQENMFNDPTYADHYYADDKETWYWSEFLGGLSSEYRVWNNPLDGGEDAYYPIGSDGSFLSGKYNFWNDLESYTLEFLFNGLDWTIDDVTDGTISDGWLDYYINWRGGWGGWYSTEQEQGGLTAAVVNAGGMLSESRSSKPVWVLHTGGNSMAKIQNLFGLSAGAVEEVGVNGVIGVGASVPYSKITVNGTQEDTNGIAWKLYPDGKDVPFSVQTGVQLAEIYPGESKYTLVHLTECTAVGNTNNDRTTIGIGELVDFSGMPANTVWSLSGGGSISSTNGSGTTFTASMSPGSATITAQVGDTTQSIPFNVLAPDGFKTTISSSPGLGTSGTNQIGQRTIYNVDVTPEVVSFKNVQFQENFPYTNVWVWPNDITNSFNPSPIPWNVSCDNNTTDDIKDGPYSKDKIFNGSNYVDFSYTIVWQEQYKNQSSQWTTFVDNETTVTDFKGNSLQTQTINRGVAGNWQGPWQ